MKKLSLTLGLTALLTAALAVPAAATTDESPADQPIDQPTEQITEPPVDEPAVEATDETADESIDVPGIDALEASLPPLQASAAQIPPGRLVIACQYMPVFDPRSGPTGLFQNYQATSAFPTDTLDGFGVGPAPAGITLPFTVDLGVNLIVVARLLTPAESGIEVSTPRIDALVAAGDCPATLSRTSLTPSSTLLTRLVVTCEYPTGSEITALPTATTARLQDRAGLARAGWDGIFPARSLVAGEVPLLPLRSAVMAADGSLAAQGEEVSAADCPVGDATAVAVTPTPPAVTPANPVSVPVAIAKPVATGTGVLPDTGGTDASLLILGGLLIVAGGATLGLRRRIA